MLVNNVAEEHRIVGVLGIKPAKTQPKKPNIPHGIWQILGMQL